MVKNKGEPLAPKRTWFQTHEERMEEKNRFKLANEESTNETNGTNKGKGKPKKSKGQGGKKVQKKNKGAAVSAEERARMELNKVMLMQARVAKKKGKPKSMRSSNDVSVERPTSVVSKKSKSAFTTDLTDTSRVSVRKLRHEGNSKGNSRFKNKKGKK